jgi:hypothetical protein
MLSVMLMGMALNWLAAGLLAFTIVFYAVVYTMWLKRWTAQNIVIGGLAGALPPVIGWAAATGHAPLNAWLLVRDHLHVDPAALLGAVASTSAGLRQGRGADDAGGRARPPPAGRSCSTAWSSSRSASRRPSPAWAARCTCPSRAGGLVFLLLAWRLFAARPATPPTRAGRRRRSLNCSQGGGAEARATCSPSRSSTCSCCSPPCWPRRAGPKSAGAVPMMIPPRRARTSIPPPRRAAAATSPWAWAWRRSSSWCSWSPS